MAQSESLTPPGETRDQRAVVLHEGDKCSAYLVDISDLDTVVMIGTAFAPFKCVPAGMCARSLTDTSLHVPAVSTA